MGVITTIKGTPPTDAYLAQPASGEPRGAVIVVHEVWGLSEHIKSVADRVAGAGYVALAPSLLGDTEIDEHATRELQESLFDPARRNAVQPQLRKLMAPLSSPEFGEQTAQRLQTCFDYLYKLPEAHQKVAVMGFCFGGSYSFTLATKEPRLTVAIPFYGHADQPAEELAGITCPVRLFLGEKDERLIAQLPDLTKRMKEAKVDFAAKVYPSCGHAFFNDTNSFAYNQEAATDAWKRVQEILAQAV